MAHSCRAFFAFALAGAIAQGSMTVSWNTRPSPAPSTPIAVQNARVLSVRGTRISLRLRDGSIANYTATPEQARLLRGLVGTDIRFRMSGAR